MKRIGEVLRIAMPSSRPTQCTPKAKSLTMNDCWCGTRMLSSMRGPYCPVCAVLRGSGLYGEYLKARRSDYADDMLVHIDGGESLFIHGPTGTGKTWLMSAMMRTEAERDIDIRQEFATFPRMMLDIRDTMRPQSEQTEAGIVRRYSRVKRLYLDDIGAEKTSEYVRTTLYLILEARQSQPRTVLTSNLSLAEIAEQHGQRIASRIVGMCRVIKLTGKDRRVV